MRDRSDVVSRRSAPAPDACKETGFLEAGESADDGRLLTPLQTVATPDV
jgi:hypothetical protein